MTLNTEMLLFYGSVALIWVLVISYIWMVWDTTKHNITYGWLFGMFLAGPITLIAYVIQRKEIIEEVKIIPSRHNLFLKSLAWVSTVGVVVLALVFSVNLSTPSKCSENAEYVGNMIATGIADHFGVTDSRVEASLRNITERYESSDGRYCRAEVYYKIDEDKHEPFMVNFRVYAEGFNEWLEIEE